MPVEHPDDKRAQLERTWLRPPGVGGWLMEVNNQPLGKRYMLTALAFFAVAGVLGLILRIQLAVSDNEWLHPDVFNAIFTMHGSTMMYLFAVPFLEGLALYLMPMVVGSRDVAFPRLTAFSYWMYLSGGLIMYSSVLFGATPDAGWFAYTPLSGPQFAGIELDFWLLGLGLVEIAAITAGAEIVVTILKMRAPGMAIHRLPILAWAFLIAGAMILFGVTPLFVATVMLELDRAMGTHFFNPEMGGSSLLWQHLFWFFGHPEVYIIFIPATGVVSAVVPVFARRPIVGYTLIVVALLITGFLSFGLWVHHMFTTGLPQLTLVFFAAASFMIALASGAQVFAWIATLWGSRPLYATPLLYILGFLFVFVIGGITGVMVATIPFDLQVHDSYFIVAHFHYVLIGGAVFPIFAGLYYWFPKFTGRMPGEPCGKIGFWLVFIGFNVTFFPMHVMGMFGMPRRVYTYPAELGLDGYNMAATVGSFVLGAGFALAMGGLLWSMWRGVRAVADPWNAGTLEWSTDSPPKSYAFRQPPVVLGLYPLWHNGAADEDAESLQATADALIDEPARWRGSLITDLLAGRPQALQPLPGPTITPLVTALGFVLTASAVLAEAYSLALVAGVFSAGMVAFWLRPVRRPLPDAPRIAERLGLPLRPTGARSTAWWGTICFIAVAVTGLGALLFSYYYLWLYSERWPQDDLPLPGLLWPTVAYGALFASVIAQVWASWSFRRGATGQAGVALAAVAALGMAFIVLEVWNLATSEFRPTDNAYGSAFFTLGWAALGLAGTGAAAVLTAVPRIVWRRSDDPDALRLHLEIAELLWFFAITAGALVYTTTYIAPRVL